ncbi:MAG: addiction module protein, partial [Myxococcales bacterium]|nr:addiction module protein [Myxococcales bacterium]
MFQAYPKPVMEVDRAFARPHIEHRVRKVADGAAEQATRRWRQGSAIIASMSERARKLLHEAMELPLSERAELVMDLLASLDVEPEADAAWVSEIERRAREALANPED